MILDRQTFKDFLAFLSKKLHYINLKRIGWWLIIILTAGFITLSFFVYFLPTTHIDISFSRELQEERHPVLDVFMKWVSVPGQRIPALASIAVVGLTCIIFRYFREALFVALAGFASVINTGLKMLIHRQRPSADIVEKVEEAQFFSFPSGHTVFYVVFYGFLIVLLFRIKKIKMWIRLLISLFFVLMIFSIPFSRVYLGAHWFSDVLGGFILGVIYLSILLYFYFKKTTTNKAK